MPHRMKTQKMNFLNCNLCNKDGCHFFVVICCICRHQDRESLQISKLIFALFAPFSCAIGALSATVHVNHRGQTRRFVIKELSYIITD